MLAGVDSLAGSPVYYCPRRPWAPAAVSSRISLRCLPVARSLQGREALALVRLACWDFAARVPPLVLPRVLVPAARASLLP